MTTPQGFCTDPSRLLPCVRDDLHVNGRAALCGMADISELMQSPASWTSVMVIINQCGCLFSAVLYLENEFAFISFVFK